MANNQNGSRVNSILVASIPINRKVKRYWVSKFERISSNCGTDEAVAKFKNLRVQVLSYLADSKRKSNLDTYLSSTGFRKNGMLRRLFEQADCQPHYVLSFLKLYSAEQKPTQSAAEAALATKERLDHVRSQEAVPVYLREWLHCVTSPHMECYIQSRKDPRKPFHQFAITHSYEEWHSYWITWFRRLRRGWTSRTSRDEKQIFPEVYKDFKISADGIPSSRSYERDLVELTAMHYLTGGLCPLNESQLAFVDEYLNDEVRLELVTNPGALNTGMPELGIESSLGGFSVGQVQHIHKKGGGTELRDIAVPNRFIQAALVPGAARLYNLVRCLPKDATFDQSKFDTLITGRVTNPNLYQGSVDLSKATDNLPLSWGEEVIDQLSRAFWGTDWLTVAELPDPEDRYYLHGFEPKERDPRPWHQFLFGFDCFGTCKFARYDWQEEKYSLDLFRTVARARWEDNGLFMSWKVGQPLGSLPSFAMLAITHNLLVESLGLQLNLSHSPYFILGDDIVITNKKLRKRYIRELSSRSIPLSLHKSFEGRLSEFAGKTYVSKCVPFHTSDHNPLTWESLFDWQRSTGIRISWDHLPKAICRKIYDVCREVLRQYGYAVNKGHATLLARSAYSLVLTCEVWGAGSRLYPLPDSEEQSELIAGYFEYRDTNDIVPDAVKHSGISILANRYPVTLMGERFADKDGHFQRFSPVKLPDWYRDKYRPCTTSAAISGATHSLLNYGNIVPLDSRKST